MTDVEDTGKLQDKIEPEDLEVSMKGGLIIAASFGSLVALREYLKDHWGKAIYFTVSSAPLYVVHWNDLSEKKQRELEARKTKL